jgi:NAD(P)-dependent dehydrogenase (short-subunit alcohol dehydrogenase family)
LHHHRVVNSWSLDHGLGDRGIIVTGAARGIGRAVAEAFAAAGARVLAVDVDPAVEAVVAGLEGSAGRHAARVCDLADLAGHGGLIDDVVALAGRFDHLAHVAAVLRRRADIDEVTEDDFDFQVGINLKASFFLMRTAATALRSNEGGGSITAFTSQGWMTGGFGGSVVYAATKGGIVSMTRGMARTYAADGVRVNTVSPGGVDTPMMLGGLTDEALASFVAGIPLGRLAEPAELAGTVVFLASDHARYITGATINVSGGFLMY